MKPNPPRQVNDHPPVCDCCQRRHTPLTRMSNGQSYCAECAQSLGRAIGPKVAARARRARA